MNDHTPDGRIGHAEIIGCLCGSAKAPQHGARIAIQDSVRTLGPVPESGRAASRSLPDSENAALAYPTRDEALEETNSYLAERTADT